MPCSWGNGAIATLSIRKCHLLSVAREGRRESAAPAPGDAVDLGRPLDGDVLDRLLGCGDEVEQVLALAALDLLDQDAAVVEADHAQLADQVRRHRVFNPVVEPE